MYNSQVQCSSHLDNFDQFRDEKGRTFEELCHFLLFEGDEPENLCPTLTNNPPAPRAEISIDAQRNHEHVVERPTSYQLNDRKRSFMTADLHRPEGAHDKSIRIEEEVAATSNRSHKPPQFKGTRMRDTVDCCLISDTVEPALVCEYLPCLKHSYC